MVQGKSPRVITWNEISDLTKQVGAQLKRNYPSVDCIVGLARGGLIPAVQLSHILDVPMITVNFSLRDNKVSTNLLEDTLMSKLDKYKHIAIVDDISDSGKTMHAVDVILQDRISQYSVDNDGALYNKFVYCSLLHKPTSMFCPKVIGEIIPEVDLDVWIRFPWEV